MLASMTVQQTAEFLTQHPDWSPTLRMDADDMVQCVGFYGPHGGFFTMEAVALAMTAKAWWARTKGKE